MPEEQREYLRTWEVAQLLSVSSKTITRWAIEGKIPCQMTLGGHRRYPRREIEELRDAVMTKRGDKP